MLALQQLPTPGRLPALTTLRPRGPHTACDAPLSARHAADARTAHDMRGAASLTAVSSMNTTALTLFCRNNIFIFFKVRKRPVSKFLGTSRMNFFFFGTELSSFNSRVLLEISLSSVPLYIFFLGTGTCRLRH
jgi:hypothetical protein